MSATRPVRVSRTALMLPVSTGALASDRAPGQQGRAGAAQGRAQAQARRAPGQAGAGRARSRPRWASGGSRSSRSRPAKGKAMRINAATGRATLQSARVTMPGRHRAPDQEGAEAAAHALGQLRHRHGDRHASSPATPLGQAPAGARAARAGAARDRARRARERHRLGAQGVVHQLHEHPAGARWRHLHLRRRRPGGGPAREPGQGGAVYRFAYRPLAGWWDAASQTAALYFAGTVNFRFYAHGIDFDTKDPEIELNGAASRAIFRLGGRRSTPYGNKRGVLVDLAPDHHGGAALRHRRQDGDLHRHPRHGPRRRRPVGLRRLLPAGRRVRRHLRQLHHALTRPGSTSAGRSRGGRVLLFLPAAAGAATVTVQGLRSGPVARPGQAAAGREPGVPRAHRGRRGAGAGPGHVAELAAGRGRAPTSSAWAASRSAAGAARWCSTPTS